MDIQKLDQAVATQVVLVKEYLFVGFGIFIGFFDVKENEPHHFILSDSRTY